MKLHATVQSVDKSALSIRGVVVPPYAAPTAARALSTCTEHTCCSPAAAMAASPQTQTIRLLSKLPKSAKLCNPIIVPAVRHEEIDHLVDVKRSGQIACTGACAPSAHYII